MVQSIKACNAVSSATALFVRSCANGHGNLVSSLLLNTVSFLLLNCCTSPYLVLVSVRSALSVNLISTLDAGTSMQKSMVAPGVAQASDVAVIVATQWDSMLP